MPTDSWIDVGASEELSQRPVQQVMIGNIKIALTYSDGQFGAVSGEPPRHPPGRRTRCNGWNPFFTAAGRFDTATTRSAAMAGEQDLVAGIAYMKEYCELAGREDHPEIVLESITAPGEQRTPQMLVDRICRYRELGVSAAGVHIDGRTRREWCDNVECFGDQVIARVG